jgi:cytochrome P450
MSNVTHGHGGSAFAEGRECRHLVGDGVPGDAVGVAAMATADGQPGWLVTGYRQTKNFLRDRRFSRAAAAAACHPRGPAARMSITDLDPPRHTRMRNLIGGALSARRSEMLRPYVARKAAELLDDLVHRGATADLLQDFCLPLTFAAQSELLGVPDARRAAVRLRATERLGPPGASQKSIYEGELLLHAEIAEMLADRDDPPTGLVADLLTAQREHGSLSDVDLAGLVSSLFFDGPTISAAQIVNTILCVISRPGLLARLGEAPDRVDGAVEEALRFCPSVNFTMTRVAVEEVELDGVHIHEGDQVTAAIPVVNRDGRVFAVPERFQPDRTGPKHLTFSHGTHHCLGAHLARVELQVAIRALAAAAPDVSLAVGEDELSWTVSPAMRTLEALPIRWNTAPALSPGRTRVA